MQSFLVYSNTHSFLLYKYVFVYVFCACSYKMSVTSEECKLKCFSECQNIHSFIHLLSLVHSFVCSFIQCSEAFVLNEKQTTKQTSEKISSKKFQQQQKKTRPKKIFSLSSLINKRETKDSKSALFSSTFLHAYLVK